MPSLRAGKPQMGARKPVAKKKAPGLKKKGSLNRRAISFSQDKATSPKALALAVTIQFGGTVTAALQYWLSKFRCQNLAVPLSYIVFKCIYSVSVL